MGLELVVAIIVTVVVEVSVGFGTLLLCLDRELASTIMGVADTGAVALALADERSRMNVMLVSNPTSTVIAAAAGVTLGVLLPSSRVVALEALFAAGDSPATIAPARLTALLVVGMVVILVVVVAIAIAEITLAASVAG